MKSRPFEQLFSVGTGFCMGFLKSSKTDHNPFLFKNCKYKAKAAQIKRFKRLMLPCVDRKDAFKALKVKNLLFFKLSNGTHILSHTSIKLFA